MATFTKLLAISIVASKRFGLSNSDKIILSFFSFLFRIFSSCQALSEKYATSDPEIIAEKNNKIKRTTKPIKASRLKVLNIEFNKTRENSPRGSVSNSVDIVII